MRGLPAETDPQLLQGAGGFADAGVYRLADDLAIVVSIDFFPPLVDDPYEYGRIAAANSLSDIYATGARPVTALNMVTFPDRDLPAEVLREIMRGGAERVHAAGAVIAGGHSVREATVNYGLAVTGTVDPARMMSNAGAQPGQVLVLTKALGTGFITTANRAGRCAKQAMGAALASMATLNRTASEAAVAAGVRGATDITGFGLSGHALEMAEASGVTLRLHLASLPLLPGLRSLLGPENHTRAIESNGNHVAAAMHVDGEPDEALRAVLHDPQTSGGLLLAVPPDAVDGIVAAVAEEAAITAAVVGVVEPKGSHALVIEP